MIIAETNAKFCSDVLLRLGKRKNLFMCFMYEGGCAKKLSYFAGRLCRFLARIKLFNKLNKPDNPDNE